MALPRFPFVWLLPVFIAATAVAESVPSPVWPPRTDIVPDPAVVSATLENGLRYAILHNREPRDRVSVRMLVAAGSLDETDDERGLAHYLEHMAFNGTRNFAADTLVEWFQRNGMSFGGDSNAATGFETTTYMLELPHTDARTLGEGLAVLRDFADGMLLADIEIEKERGIIFAEKRARDSVEFRTVVAELEFILPGTLPPQRFPIGVAETLEAADTTRLRAFYERWYVPANIILSVVGDIDVATVEELIRKNFGDLPSRAPLPARANRGGVTPLEQPLVAIHREPEASSVAVSIQVATPYQRQPDSAADRLRDLPLEVANSIISRRLSELAKKENAPFNGGGAGSTEAFDFARVASIELTGPPDRWRDALAVADQEIRRALEHGFAPVELKEVAANLINNLEEAVRAAPTRRSEGLASALASAIHRERVFTTPETNLALFRPAVAALTTADCLSALRTAWNVSAPRIFVSGRLGETDTVEAVTTVFQASRSQAVSAPDAPSEDVFAYTHFGPTGAVVRREHIEDLDLELVEFANGVRLNLKRTDFRANSISLRARLGGGRLELPLDRPELAAVAGAVFNESGLGEHTRDDLRRILAGRSVGIGLGVSDDAFQFGGGATPKDLELALQLLCAYIIDPGWREEVLPLIRRNISQSYERMLHLPGGIAHLKIPPLLASGDPRFGTPPLEKLLAVTAADVRAWINPVLAESDLEVAIVGDIDIEQTIEIAARTIGALPARNPRSDFESARHVHYPDVPPHDNYTVETEIQKCLVLTYWPTDDAWDISRTRRLGLLASVFDDRLRKIIREELGAAYSPNASSNPSDAFRGYGLFSVSVEVDPARATEVQTAILRISDDLHAHGVTDDEIERAREPVLTAIRESVRQNGYWLNAVVDEAQTRPEFLDYARTRESDIRSITTADLSTLAARYLDNSRAAQFVIEPVSKP